MLSPTLGLTSSVSRPEWASQWHRPQVNNEYQQVSDDYKLHMQTFGNTVRAVRRWFDSDAGVLSEAKPVAPTRASSQRPGLWKPLAPHALRAGLRLHPVGGLSMERLIRSML